MSWITKISIRIAKADTVSVSIRSEAHEFFINVLHECTKGYYYDVPKDEMPKTENLKKNAIHFDAF